MTAAAATGFAILNCILLTKLVDVLRRLVHLGHWLSFFQFCIFYTSIYLLFLGYAIYLLARFGFGRRLIANVPTSRREIEQVYLRESPIPALIVLVPSYREEAITIFQTLMSAALAEYPRRRVTLLIDDPPVSSDSRDGNRLEAARRLPRELSRMLREASAPFAAARLGWERRAASGKLCLREEAERLSRLYEHAAEQLEEWTDMGNGETSSSFTHTDRLFAERILREPARAHRGRAGELRAAALTAAEIDGEYRRLAALFDVDVSSFERKRYANLSREPNKAMNLNAYLALLGGSYRERATSDGLHLERCDRSCAQYAFADAEYIGVLDADSFVLSDYFLRLFHVLDQPQNADIGMAQTPYAAIPESASLLERIAGATTDLHYFVQQGVSHFEGAFWVGPNALIRQAALEDIALVRHERGHAVKVYIQDQTVIEDTGSTIDLIRKGWRLYNYLGRLAYSATPADFGSLIIQRRRWANGGLILLSSLLSHIYRGPKSGRKFLEAAIRIYTLLSPAVVSVSMLVLIFCSIEPEFLIWWLPLVAIPYYVLLACDLKAAGYRLSDLLRVGAIQLTLIPVLLGGTLQSVRQLVTGKKTAFARTPKIAGRTSAPVVYLLAHYGIFAFCLLSIFGNFVMGRYYCAAISSLFGAAYLYGIVRYIGIRATAQDLLAAIVRRRAGRDLRPTAVGQQANESVAMNGVPRQSVLVQQMASDQATYS